MPLEFVGDAISLSGETGTQLKCEVIGSYYPFWWKITSGGKSGEYQKLTAIVELNAATGEDYIEDTGEIVLGSSGHAMELKVNHLGDNEIDTTHLKVVLIEEDVECYNRLKRVIKRRWPNVPIKEAEGPLQSNFSNIYLLKMTLDDALPELEKINLGNAIYYFDPLRSVSWSTIEKVARVRMKNVFQTGTEFIIFLFTSDWFLGRKEFAPLPETSEEKQWSLEEKRTVTEADELLGNQRWHKYVLTTQPTYIKERLFVNLYKRVLNRWFRYVLAMPFTPKEDQLFHLVLCSNFEVGVRMTKDSYASRTNNPPYLPGRAPEGQTYGKFKAAHPEMAQGLSGKERPLEWRILWKTIKYHEGGVCDFLCRDFRELEPDPESLKSALDWLYQKGYLRLMKFGHAWQQNIKRYNLNWQTIKATLNLNPPPELKPISPEEFESFQLRRIFEILDRAGKSE